MKFKYWGKLSRIKTNGESPLDEGQPDIVTGTFTALPQKGVAFAIHADHSQSTIYPEGFYRMTSLVQKHAMYSEETVLDMDGIEFTTLNSTYILSQIKELNNAKDETL